MLQDFDTAPFYLYCLFRFACGVLDAQVANASLDRRQNANVLKHVRVLTIVKVRLGFISRLDCTSDCAGSYYYYTGSGRSRALEDLPTVVRDWKIYLRNLKICVQYGL